MVAEDELDICLEVEVNIQIVIVEVYLNKSHFHLCNYSCQHSFRLGMDYMVEDAFGKVYLVFEIDLNQVNMEVDRYMVLVLGFVCFRFDRKLALKLLHFDCNIHYLDHWRI